MKLKFMIWLGTQNIYRIYDKYQVSEDDMSCISQNTSNQKIVTLITCNNINNSERLIIKAK